MYFSWIQREYIRCIFKKIHFANENNSRYCYLIRLGK